MNIMIFMRTSENEQFRIHARPGLERPLEGTLVAVSPFVKRHLGNLIASMVTFKFGGSVHKSKLLQNECVGRRGGLEIKHEARTGKRFLAACLFFRGDVSIRVGRLTLTALAKIEPIP